MLIMYNNFMETNKLTIKDSSISFFVGFLLCQLSVVFVTCIGLFITTIANIDTSNLDLFLNTSYGYLICVLAMDLTMLAVFFFMNRKKENSLIAKPSAKKIFMYIGIAILSFFCLYPLITCIDSLLTHFGFSLNTIPYELNTTNYLVSLISLVVLPAICEELLFRGLIFKGLKRYGKIFSIVISAVMFSIYHMSLDQTVYPLLIGLLLGVIMYYENNILYCIAIHLTNNFLSLTLSYLNVPLMYQHWTYILIAIVLATVFITLVLYFTIKNHKNHPKESINAEGKIYFYVSIIIMLILWIITNCSK